MNAMKLAIPLFVALAYGPAQGLAAPILGSDLASFAVLGAAGVTNVPTSTIGGNLGSAPTASCGGGYTFTGGSLQCNTGSAIQAQLDLDAAITTLNLMANTGGTLGADLTGTRAPGVYEVLAGTTNLSGALVLDGGGNDNAVWVFRFASTLITDTISSVTVEDVGDGSNVGIYWVVGTGATLNGSTFAGNVLANTLISSDGDLTLGCGRLLSATSQVTLIHDTISIGCTGSIVTGGGGVDVATSGGFDQAGVAAIPEPETYAMLLAGLGLLGFAARRRKLKAAAAAA